MKVKMIRVEERLHRKLKAIAVSKGMVFERFVEGILQDFLKVASNEK